MATLRLRRIAFVFFFLVCSSLFATWFYSNSQPERSVSGIRPPIMAELLDTRNPATLMPREAFINPVVVPVSSIDMTIDRRVMLKDLFARVAAGEVAEDARVEAWVHYLHNRIAQPRWTPLLDNGQAIYDPYWILKNRLGLCGQINRVVVDGLNAVGFQARLVQLMGHVVAEVWLSGGWRILDADRSDLSKLARHEDGTIASAYEIYRNPRLVEHGRYRIAKIATDIIFLLRRSQSYSVLFSAEPYYYYKTATHQQEHNEYYGWNYYKTVHE